MTLYSCGNRLKERRPRFSRAASFFSSLSLPKCSAVVILSNGQYFSRTVAYFFLSAAVACRQVIKSDWKLQEPCVYVCREGLFNGLIP